MSLLDNALALTASVKLRAIRRGEQTTKLASKEETKNGIWSPLSKREVLTVINCNDSLLESLLDLTKARAAHLAAVRTTATYTPSTSSTTPALASDAATQSSMKALWNSSTSPLDTEIGPSVLSKSLSASAASSV